MTSGRLREEKPNLTFSTTVARPGTNPSLLHNLWNSYVASAAPTAPCTLPQGLNQAWSSSQRTRHLQSKNLPWTRDTSQISRKPRAKARKPVLAHSAPHHPEAIAGKSFSPYSLSIAIADKCSGLVLGTFNDTQWDVSASQSAKVASLKKQCQDLAKDIKPPTRFPIVPFASTLAREQAEAAARDRRGRKKRSASMYGDDLEESAEEKPATVVDKRGRTRAASKKQATMSAGQSERSQTAIEPQKKIEVQPRRRRRWEEDGGYDKTEMAERSDEVWKDDEAREPGKTYNNGVEEVEEAHDDQPLLVG